VVQDVRDVFRIEPGIVVGRNALDAGALFPAAGFGRLVFLGHAALRRATPVPVRPVVHLEGIVVQVEVVVVGAVLFVVFGDVGGRHHHGEVGLELDVQNILSLLRVWRSQRNCLFDDVSQVVVFDETVVISVIFIGVLVFVIVIFFFFFVLSPSFFLLFFVDVNGGIFAESDDAAGHQPHAEIGVSAGGSGENVCAQRSLVVVLM